MLSELNVAITGATGFIGKHLVPGLLAEGHNLTLLGRDFEKLQASFAIGDTLRLVQSDYENDLDALLDNVDAIVHLGQLRYRQNRALTDYIKENVTTTDALFSAAANRGVGNIVYASSIAVYNPAKNQMPFTEEQSCWPDTHHGVNKLMCEQISSYYNQGFGLKVKSLRIGQVIGLEERRGFMLATMIDQAKAGKRVCVWGEGVGARDYIYIKDVVAAIANALRQPELEGAFNVSLGKPVTHLDLAETINKAFGNAGNLIVDANRPEDKSRRYMSCLRAARDLNWRAEWGLSEMFDDMA